ncbi:MAG TPA: OmpA family protein [Solirubrobacteraceae bacterium]|jgi:chemotaxis protein MotB|nr:OmpA family protein [Solirubrobacteraceae bacterium]
MARGHGSRRRGHGAEHDNDERWLLTYADMITLLMALFMVLFSISSVNISKYRTLQMALKAAFSGDILPGGKSIEQPGASANSSRAPTTIDTPAIVRLVPNVTSELEHVSGGQSGSAQASAQSAASSAASVQVSAAQQEQASFEALQRELNAYAAKHGFAKSVHVAIEQRGLAIRVLTDSLLFSSGSATLESQGAPLLTEIAALLNVDHVHPIAVEGNTDNVPISGTFPSNWELSTARASSVVRFLIAKGVDSQRLSAVGYAEQHPIATNATPAGRALNRRVEIVLQRLY